jgi:hypothetical protein
MQHSDTLNMTGELRSGLSQPDGAAMSRRSVQHLQYVARALRNETLRQQLAASPLPEDGEWLDMAEADEAAGS